MDDGTPMLEIGMIIDPAESFGELARLRAEMNTTEYQLVQSAKRVERETGGMVNASAVVGQITTVGNATTRSEQEIRREKRNTERQIERMIAVFDRETQAVGRSREEQRAARAEALALASARDGNTDAANRLTASMRALEAAQSKLSEDNLAAEMRAQAAAAAERERQEAALNAQLLERSRLEAALDRLNGTDRPTAAQGGATVSALAERERALELAEREAAAEQELIAAQRQQNSLLAERASIQSALERTTGLGRTSAVQSGASFSALTQMVREEEELAAAADRIRASLNPAAAAQKRFNDEIAVAQRAVGAGVLSLDEYVGKLRMERAALKEVEDAQKGMNDANRRTQQDLRMIAVQLPDIIGGLLTGQKPLQVLIQQGGQITQQAQMAEGGIAGLARSIGSLLTPAAIAAGATGVAVIAAVAAWWQYSDAVQKSADLARGAGLVIGATADNLEAGAEAASRAGNMSVAAARDVQNSYVQMGGIGRDVLAGLTATTTGFARATGQDAAGAAKELGAAFQDPVKGAEDLTLRYGILTQAQIDHIQELVQQNDLYGAQQVLLGGLAPQFDKAAVHATGLAGAWDAIATAASNAWTAMGKAIDRALGGGTLTQKIEDQYQQRYRYLQQTGGFGDTSVYDKRIADMQAQLKAEQAAERERSAAAQARVNGQKAMAIVGRVTGGDQFDKLKGDLGIVNSVLADTGRLSNFTSEQLKDLRQSQEMLSNAVRTYIPPAEKAVRLAQLDAQIAAAKTPARKAELAAQKAQVEASGKLVTTEEAQATAAANAARARVQASRSGQSHAETLAREAASTEAQIRNLYALGTAYGVSSGAALIAEARVKAESRAIKDRGDIGAAVDRQIRLSIAQRVSDADKGVASMEQQADIQAKVNASVAAGLTPASQAIDLVRAQMEDLPLLAAIQAAQSVAAEAAGKKDVARQKAFTDAAEKASKALRDQQKARADLEATKVTANYNADIASGSRRLAELRTELDLVGQTDAARAHQLAIVQALQYAEAQRYDTFQTIGYVATQVKVVDLQEQLRLKTEVANEKLTYQSDILQQIAENVSEAASGMADAFGDVGRAIGDLTGRFAAYRADQEKLNAVHRARLQIIGSMVNGEEKSAAIERENSKFALRTATTRIDLYGDMAGAAKGFFSENSKGYEILAATEKAYRAIQFAMSVRAMAQDVAETLGIVSNSAARATAQGTEGIAAQSKLPFPFNIVAMAATAGALVAAGVAVIGSLVGGGGHTAQPTNTGTGTVLGDTSAKSESIKRAIDELKAVDTLTNVYSRQMLASLKSIDSQLSGVASVIVRGGDINASGDIVTGYNNSQGKGIGSVAGFALGGALLGPIGALAGGLLGKILGGLFGTRTDVTGSGIYGGAQSLGSVLNGGFNGQAYSDVTKTHKFLGIVSGRSYSTEYGALDPNLSNQFTLILRSFNDSIKAAAGPLGESTDAIQQRLNGFVVNIGKIDLKGLTGEQIQEKLNAVFGAAADNMATAAFPLVSQYQKVGEGAFETLIRVASTVEQVTTSLDLLGTSTRNLGVGAKLGLADQFDSVSALTDAAGAYFQAFYTQEEQAAAKTAQMAKVFASLGFAVPPTLASFRQLVEAQDLNTAAGQAAYATLLKLAPAFADLQQSMEGAKSAADILSERQDLERQLLELQGKTDEIRKLDLAKLDASNRAIQLQIWAIQDAQDAAKAADDLRQAWKSVGDSITDEIKRIRGLSDATGSNTFASLLGQFNAASAAARGGDQDAAKSLPQLSQALLAAAADAATSRQELDRVQAQTAASLQQTYDAITAFGAAASSQADAARLSAAATAQAAAGGSSNDNAAAMADLRGALQAVVDKVEQLRSENNAGNAAIAGNTGRVAKVLDNVTSQSGGDAIATVEAA
ncbi:hypothetical protein CA234_09740 [Sphingomonas sp. ABOLE]|uniref:phage tail length tape measure family protein n=1 Tax=Sphingomonas sp. ABOLE TaxID=1985878 RepID=UPI000F7EDA1F|nr:phage tail length tape measure family protein [Sphingomonas sp. ABOLE]RSV41539.1 hypothetical protein CA234_09740 [Sphingomonas sp. ABOLE]